MKAIAQTRLVAMIRSDAQRFEALKREIVHLDYFCKGTVLKRMMKCGNKKCACHRDPAKRHGPYFESFKALGIRTDHGDQSGLGDCFHSLPTVYYTVEI